MKGIKVKNKMKEYQDIVDLYREIGREFRSLGAEKVFLMNSRTNVDSEKEMYLEIAVEGAIQKEKAEEKKQLWPFLEMTITVIDEISDRDSVNEIYEDGIIL